MNYFKVSLLATILALAVVMLGAFTRLSDAGLGCPDWPGCYGQMVAPHTSSQISEAKQAFPGAKIEPAKAWAEMVHRYFAGTLGVLILILTIWAYRRRLKGDSHQMIVIPTLLVLLVIFQAVLGMWTVTWLVFPLIVSAHLLAGMTLAALLWALTLNARNLTPPSVAPSSALRFWAILGLLIVFGQIFLGAWTSTNYASIICEGFPFCQGSFFPPMDFHAGFNFVNPIGLDYQGGLLSTPARVAIQMTHRYGAFFTAGYVILFALALLFTDKRRSLKLWGLVLLGVLMLQFCLGVANVEFLLPMPIAVSHNGGAALLLLTMVAVVYRVFQRQR
jgi:cytochrome c oxidase assembly protein subunit 15